MNRLLKLFFALMVAVFMPIAARAQTQVNWLTNIRNRPNILLNPDGITNLMSGNSANPMLTITQLGAGNALTLTGNLLVTGNVRFTGTQSFTTWCAASSCTPQMIAPKIVAGISSALNGASPAVTTVTGLGPYTSTSTFSCTANEEGTGASTAVLVTHNASTTSFTITGPNGATATVHWICAGY